MDEIEKDFLRKPLSKPTKEFKVKCLGWCNKEFMSESKFIRFCERCKSKKIKISEDNSLLGSKSMPAGMICEKEGFDF
jgi:hypothetical protein